MLRTLSSCAKALPADAEWDVSGLLYDGQRFSRETVSCWLQCGCSAVHAEDEQLETDSISMLSTVTGLAQVLAFANAVGSSKGLCRAACSQLKNLTCVVQLPEQVLELRVAEYPYTFAGSQVVRKDVEKGDVEVGAPLVSAEQLCNVRQQLAQQLSALLQLAHVQRLQPLLDVLHQFLLLNVFKPGGNRLLSGFAGVVFTDVVLEAALGSSTLSKEAYVSSILSQPCSLSPNLSGYGNLLKPVGPRIYESMTDTLKFDAMLLRDFAGSRAGDTVTVQVNLFGPGSMGGSLWLKRAGTPETQRLIWLPAQLVIGRAFSDAAALKAFLAADPPVE